MSQREHEEDLDAGDVHERQTDSITYMQYYACLRFDNWGYLD